MTAISMTSMGINPDNGRLESGYITVGEGVNFIGTIGHGNTLRITDSLARFGTRQNVKPLFVNFGDSRFGHALGRITSEHINSNCALDTGVKNGSLASSYRYDIKNFGDNGMLGQPITTQDQAKPLIQYVERLYGFDFDDPRIQNNFYYFNGWDENNTYTHTMIIDGRTYTHTNDGTESSRNNAVFVRDYIIDLINADTLCKCTASVNDGRLELAKKNPTDYFDVTYPGTYREEIRQNFNNKTARIYAWDNSTPNDAIMITHGYGNESIVYMENTDGSLNQDEYDAKPEIESWMSETLILKNSSAAGVSDGYYRHYKNSELLNPDTSLVTYDAGEQPLGRCFLMQMSNGPYGYWREDLTANLGYQYWDDEYSCVYFCDSAVITDETIKVPQPPIGWQSNYIDVQQVHTFVNPLGAHIHVLLADGVTFIYLGQRGV